MERFAITLHQLSVCKCESVFVLDRNVDITFDICTDPENTASTAHFF